MHPTCSYIAKAWEPLRKDLWKITSKEEMTPKLGITQAMGIWTTPYDIKSHQQKLQEKIDEEKEVQQGVHALHFECRDDDTSSDWARVCAAPDCAG